MRWKSQTFYFIDTPDLTFDLFCTGEEEEEEHHSGHVTKRFTQSKKPLTLELIKGTLLTMADQMVTTIAEVILENAEHDKAGKWFKKWVDKKLQVMKQSC